MSCCRISKTLGPVAGDEMKQLSSCERSNPKDGFQVAVRKRERGKGSVLRQGSRGDERTSHEANTLATFLTTWLYS